MVRNEIKELLCSLNICDENSIEGFFPKVRDREDISVLRCRKSGVIFLSRSDHINRAAYEDKEGLNYWGDGDRKKNLLTTSVDDQRRSLQFRDAVAGKIWLDVGTGLGGILDLLAPVALETLSVEPQAGARSCLKKLGYNVYAQIKDVDRKGIETVTLFHVLEHFCRPVESLRLLKARMKSGGKIIIEVPHANDFLITFLGCEAFKEFTFWSEHLILHTKESLRIFLADAGFENIVIEGMQRYPLANHLYWLSRAQPGGHDIWSQLKDKQIDESYEGLLKKLNHTDTLIAVAEA